MKQLFTLFGKKYCLFLTLLLVAGFARAQVSGTAFRDYNFNGVKDNTAAFNEPFVQGVTVRAYNSANVQVGPVKTTNASGAYNFTAAEIAAGTAVRIEFSGLAAGDMASRNGTGNSTAVQFVTAGAGVTANFAVNAPDDYWNNSGQPNPKLLAIVYAHGDINHTNSANTTFGIVQIDNNSTGSTPAKVSVATQAQVGSLWGIGYQKNYDRYFFGSFLKRHVGLGPRGIGGVYMAELSGGNYTLTGSFSLQGVMPANSATALDMGSVNRVSAPNTSDFYLATGSDAAGKDLDAFAKAGKMGFGDVEVDETGQRLVLVNLNQRRLVTVDITGGTATLNNASAATLGPLTRAYDILTLPGVPSCTSGQLRPFALKIYKGRGYLGAVCDASATPRDSTNLSGYVLSFDPANIAAGFTTEITFNFNYRTSTSNANTNRWHSWADVWADVRSSGLYRYPEPLVSDLEFDENGGINISITDRFGHQMGVAQTLPVAGSTTVAGEARISGDILHACRVGTAWVMEGAAGSCTPANTVDNRDGYGDGQTVGAFEYYNDESGDNAVGEYTEGAMAKLMGSNRLLQTIVDPTPTPSTTGEPYWYTAGMHWYDVNSGGWSNWVSLYEGSGGTPTAGTFLKGNGLGDIEFATGPQPVQIGNRVWNDANSNGIQDAGETGINGIAVQLVSPGPNGIFGDGDDVIVATATTATINGQAGSYFFNTLTTNDARKPALWAGVANNAILPGFDYQVRIANATGGSQQAALAGLQPTLLNTGSNTFDHIDSDGTLSGVTLTALFNSANTDHSFDFGFKPLAALGNRVWRDDDADGTQDTGEPGVAGVQVTLLRDLNSDGDFADAGENAPFASTVTDAYGNYLFENLPTGNYQVQITAPANYSITTQTNTADNELAGAATGSDVNAVTGRSYTVVLSAGELEPDIDAGLIFNTPAATANIGDRVWLDTDQDGVQDAGEPGIAGVTVTLYNNAGVAIATTVTDANGNYLFQDVTPGAGYRVGFTQPAGMLFSPKDLGGNDNTDSDVNTSGVNFGRTDAFTVVAGTNNLTLDAGLYPQNSGTLASLGDFVWNDLDQDGIQDAGEPGVPGVTVELLSGGGSLLAATVTDAFGKYQFNSLLPGSYAVRFTLPPGYAYSPANAGADDFKNSDAGRGVNANTSQAVSLNAGTNNPSVDAGIFQTAPAGTSRIGDKVWFDADKDGIQDAGEPGVPGVTVRLYTNGVDGLPGTADDVLQATTVTDATGFYQFANLPNGSYNVGFGNLPAGYGFTTKDQTLGGGTDANDSDADPATGRTGTISIAAPGTSIQTVDAGLTPGNPSGKGSLGNRVWYDLDNDGIQDAGEGGVPGVTVNLQRDLNNDGDFADAGEAAFATTTTNALGEYMFFNLDGGSYRVQFSNLPTGYAASPQNAGTNDAADSDGSNITGGNSTTGVYSLAQGEDNLTVDLGINSGNRNTVGDQVWFDLDADGVQDAGEPGVAGVTVTLLDGAGNVYDSNTGAAGVQPLVTTTAANGNYIFSNLPDGSYSVQFSNFPGGLGLTTRDQTAGGGNDNNDSDADLITGRTAAVTVGAGNRLNTSLDAGLISTRAALGNYVWIDDDGDGVQDAAEPVVPGVTVSLFFDANNDGDFLDAGENLPVASMITNQDGEYLFTNLNPGNYQVQFSTIPAGLSYTVQNSPGDNGNNTNSDAGNTGLTATIALAAGEADLSVDGGLTRPTASVGDFVWFDQDSDGLQDAGEPGVPGVIATLYNAGGNVLGSAVTDGNGYYLINNVPPGTGYYIIFSNKPAGNFTTQNVGGTGAANNSKASTATGQTTSFNVTAGQLVSNIDAGIIPNIIVPVRFTGFQAEKRGATAFLNWTVAAEQPGMKYEVERSTNGINFTAIGTVNGSLAGAYTYTDQQPVSGAKNYYRIRQTDANGRSVVTDIRWVRFDGDVAIEIYPNPASSQLNINLGNTGPVMAVLTAVNGQQVKSQTLVAGSNQLDVSGLAPGLYQVRISSSSEILATKQIIVQ